MEVANKASKRVKYAKNDEVLGSCSDYCHDISSSNEEEETSVPSYTDYSSVLPGHPEGNQSINIGIYSEYHAASKLTTKLNEMLSDPGLSDIITWLPHGRSFMILQRKTFARKVLPRYYEHSNLESFLRLVNAWGFRRVNTGPDRGSFYHELFLRGMPHLHDYMKRMKSKGRKVRADTDENCPNFYEMAYLPSLQDCTCRSKSRPSSDFREEKKVGSKVKTPRKSGGSCSTGDKKRRRKKSSRRTKGFVSEGGSDFVSGADKVYARSISFTDQKEQPESHHRRKRHKHNYGNTSPGLMAEKHNVRQISPSDAYCDNNEEEKKTNSLARALPHYTEAAPPQNRNAAYPKESISDSIFSSFEPFSKGGPQTLPAPLRWSTDDVSCVTGPSSKQSKSSSHAPISTPPQVNQHQIRATPTPRHDAFPMSRSIESVVSTTSDLLSMPLTSIFPSAASPSNFKMLDMITSLLLSNKADWTDYRGSEQVQAGVQLLRAARDAQNCKGQVDTTSQCG